ncbi:tetratricopeptide repeat protein [Vibrio maerlii]|uniref:tetratricopeptide repeat protein n=1 Tax=Vibrio maerlii TaxID=2231648 RepID=UPI000E3EDE0B|nr:hypothetical protein [Vibrio maerlii]
MLRVLFIVLFSVFFTDFLAAAEAPVTSEKDLASWSQDTNQPLDLRVDATRALRGFDGPNALIAVSRASREIAPRMRVAAIDAAAHWSVIGKWDLMYPLTTDVDLSVQKAAIFSLLPHWQEFDKPMRLSLEKSIEHLEKNLPKSVESELELAWVEHATGNLNAAEERLINLNHSSEDMRVIIGLSKIQLQSQGGEVARQTLEEALVVHPSESSLYYEIAKLNYSLGEYQKAQSSFEMAHSLSPLNSTYAYTLATAIRDTQPKRATELFDIAYQGSQDPTHLYAKCDILLAIKDDASTCIAELELVAPAYIVQDLVSSYQ